MLSQHFTANQLPELIKLNETLPLEQIVELTEQITSKQLGKYRSNYHEKHIIEDKAKRKLDEQLKHFKP